MKKFKMLMMVILTIMSVSVFAQISTNSQTKITKQNPEKVIYSCPLHHDMVMDNLGVCQDLRSSLNLSLKEKMKWEAMKIGVSSLNINVRSDMQCNSPQNLTVLNLSPKEKMKWEAMRLNNSLLGSYVNTANTCHMMNVLISDKQISCQYCSSTLNLSPKEKMKREAMKI